MLSIRHIASVVSGTFLQFHQDDQIGHLVTDSRRLVYPDTSLFFALFGQRRDGHLFIADLYLRGVRNFVVYKKIDTSEFPDANFILVENSLNALQALTEFHRKQFNLPVIGITGSNGKTIVKEWLNQLLEERYRIVRSPRSYNSQIGVPLSIWQINEQHQLAIIEAGISQTGEMSSLEKIISPTIGVFTNIGEAHSQGFRDIQEKINEKLELFKHSQVVIFPSDQAELKKAVLEWRSVHPETALISVGRERDCTVQIIKVDKDKGISHIAIAYSDTVTDLEINFDDDASIQNALICVAVMLCLKVPAIELQHHLSRLNPLAMRMELKSGINHCTVINDSYSADISSLKMALDFLQQQKQHSKRTVILSDILETGRRPQSLYKEVADLLRKYPVDRLIGVGPQLSVSDLFLREAGLKEMIFFKNTEALLDVLPDLEFKDEAILLKGARVFGFERIDRILTLQIHETMLEVNLEAMAHNLKAYQQLLKPSTKLMAMVKAFSYGTGGYEVARLLEFHKVDFLGVAYVDEGVSLRKAGIRLPIVVMNTEENAMPLLIEWQLEPVVFSIKGLIALQNVVRREAVTNFPVHIELETGMNRLGLSPKEIPELLSLLNGSSFQVVSVFSHLAASEESQQDEFTQRQFETYLSMTKRIQDFLGYHFIKHISNSAAVVREPAMEMDMVRVGIGLYGIDPSNSALLNLIEVGTLKTTIAQIKQLDRGDTVGYNRIGIADKPMRIGTIRLGYADGYFRSLGNGNGKVFCKGKLVPTIGNICMDMTMINLSEVPDAKEGDEVVIFGKDLSVVAVANWAGTNAYDMLAGISQRVKRIYYE